ncbi:MAG TPA: hypothetical protein PK668_15330 [Myxococcota bacterium]|nr:hypothetical protein [Myxococcota bacterium]HRY94268.1 hypothetical protein [Myxococcota bacterium]HSA24121.1 hypothetical protein [Myxococcota bacterium]
MRTKAGLLVAGLLLAGLVGCTPGLSPEQTGPVETYLAFYGAVSSADWERAAQLLDPDTVAAFRALGRELAESVGSQAEPLDFFLRGVQPVVAAPLRQPVVVRQESGAAVLRVRAGECAEVGPPGPDCLQREVRMVSRQGRWWIQPELPAGLRPQAAGKQEVKP